MPVLIAGTLRDFILVHQFAIKRLNKVRLINPYYDGEGFKKIYCIRINITTRTLMIIIINQSSLIENANTRDVVTVTCEV